jgi:hypothetical protein
MALQAPGRRRCEQARRGDGACRLSVRGLRALRFPLAIVAFVSWAAVAQTQTVINPHVVSFVPSPDHDAFDSAGQPIVTSYDLEICQLGSSQPFLVLPLGKPDRRWDGIIAADFATMSGSAPMPGVPLEARVVAVGPGGRGASAPSNVFVFEGCPIAVGPASLPVASRGGRGNVNVSAARDCGWQSWTTSSWISITGGSIGSGSGAVAFTVTENPTMVERSDSLWVGSRAVTVVQGPGLATPAVRVTSPADGARFAAPARITVSAAFTAALRAGTASPASRDRSPTSDRTIGRVSFYANGRLVGSASASPYRITWTTGVGGTFAIIAIATDNRGVQAWSGPAVSVTVEGGPSAPLPPAKPRK